MLLLGSLFNLQGRTSVTDAYGPPPQPSSAIFLRYLALRVVPCEDQCLRSLTAPDRQAVSPIGTMCEMAGIRASI